MSVRKFTLTALVLVFSMAHLACYNTYTINKDELRKLEASVDRYEIVEVLADCPGEGIGGLDGADGMALYAEAEPEAAAQQAEETATDARIRRVETENLRGCTLVPVSTVNALTLLTMDGGEQRVTPFNFVMDNVQLVSPEYDVLLQLDQVEGAQVREFSTWKTAATITGVTMLTVGTFVGLSLLAPEEQPFN